MLVRAQSGVYWDFFPSQFITIDKAAEELFEETNPVEEGNSIQEANEGTLLDHV